MAKYKDLKRRADWLRDYNIKNREQILAAKRAYYAKNREKVLASQKAARDARTPTSEEIARKEAREQKRLHGAPSRAAYQRKWRTKHLAARQEYARNWRRANPEKEQSYKRTRRQKDLYILDDAAGRPRPNACDICGGNHPNRRHNGIVFDHCHQRGHFRGWLCDRCNRTLGAVEDNSDLLRKMIAYLERHAETQSPQLTLPGV